MRFEYRYFGSSAVRSGASDTSMSFAPDTRRDPVHFRGTLSRKLPFREAISALHDVVVSDQRFQPRDRTEYLAWRERQDELDWDTIDQQRADVAKQIADLKAEMAALHKASWTRMQPYYEAQRKYFNHLLRTNYDFWLVLDPVVTVHPDEVFFECFSKDESTYGRLGCSHEVFTGAGEFACGTTNVDYSAGLYDEFQKIRGYKDTTLAVDASGFEVQTGTDDGFKEVKIDLPESWVRGFLQVSAAMSLPAVSFDLHPVDVHNLLWLLKRRKETHGPRSLRFKLTPGAPVAVEVEPFGITLECPRSRYEGDEPREIRVWGRRRLGVLERLLPVTDRFRVTLLGSGMPSFWVAEAGPLHFTLGLSGWTANDWSASGNFDLLAPRAEVDSHTLQVVFDALAEHRRLDTDELVAHSGIDRASVLGAMGIWTQAGRAMFDLRSGVWRHRELSREPLPLESLRFTNEREERAALLVSRRLVRDLAATVALGGAVVLRARVDAEDGEQTTELSLDPDARITTATCTCGWYIRHKLNRGPCEHILAARLAHRDRG